MRVRSGEDGAHEPKSAAHHRMRLCMTTFGSRLADRPAASPRATLTAAMLGFFLITLDAVVVNVALPSIDQAFDAGVTGLQWVVDGYTMMFAALLPSAGALSDRIGARRAFAGGLVVFVAASIACGAA